MYFYTKIPKLVLSKTHIYKATRSENENSLRRTECTFTQHRTFTPLGNFSLAAEETKYHPSVGQVKEVLDTATFI